MPHSSLVVLVNGPPGAGKTTLARPLAEALGIPLLCKDMIKETWADILGSEPPDGRPQSEWNSLFGAAASQTLWNLLAVSPRGGLIDSPLPARTRHHVEAGLAAAGLLRPLEIWCDVPSALLRTRREQRRASLHPIHGALMSPVDSAEVPGDDKPLGLGPVLRVDTTRTVDVAGVAAWCRSQ